jgi:hypothetical protein
VAASREQGEHAGRGRWWLVAAIAGVAVPLVVLAGAWWMRLHNGPRKPEMVAVAAKPAAEPATRTADRPRIRFLEAAEEGVDFVYFEGPDETTKGVRQFEQTGGGVAVLDLDGDEWPDLYLPQGAEWPHGATRPLPTDRFTDRLYRNVGGTFEDVTDLANLGSRDFGQGAAVGDVDGDGFPDLYVANVGRNRLYLNNGDGTFTEAEDFTAGDTNDDWTTSVAIVDIDDDGLPDLVDVNYLTGENVYTLICNGHACSPHGFDGVPDRLRLNRGDGTFETVPDATPRENAKGLGVVAFVLDDPRRPALFVANDQVANHLLASRASEGRFDVRFEELGLLRGLSFDGNGRAMGCMGVAADDADGDGRLDLFVTNFARESNTLYLQDADGLFDDRTRRAGLERPSLEFVGWGTQFLDADRDGAPDLVLANGHVDDYRDEGGGYRMRPQFFRNRGGGVFEELAAAEVGSFFAHESLGRGLATLDWQRDGLTDFAVSRIGERTALVANRTENPGRFLTVRLHAVRTARDAIGASVTVTAGGRRHTRQLTAGDGYMASNERLLAFGLGQVDAIERVDVTWPSGGRTVVEHPPTDVTLELVEDSPHGVLWRGTRPESLPVEVSDRRE